MSIFLDHNGSYLQRRKMYNGIPFHNMASKVELNWIPDDPASHQQTKKHLKIMKEQQQIKSNYDRIMENKIQQKYQSHTNRMRNINEAETHERGKDILTKEVDLFNQYKSKEISNYNQNSTINPEHLPSGQQDFGSASYERMPSQNEMKDRDDNKETNSNHQRSRYYSYNQRIINPINNSLILQKYSTLSPKGSFSPYPQPTSYRQIQQMYNGYVPHQRPFRNVNPDKLQNYLRQKTKSDRKRAILVPLNLFKH